MEWLKKLLSRLTETPAERQKRLCKSGEHDWKVLRVFDVPHNRPKLAQAGHIVQMVELYCSNEDCTASRTLTEEQYDQFE